MLGMSFLDGLISESTPSLNRQSRTLGDTEHRLSEAVVMLAFPMWKFILTASTAGDFQSGNGLRAGALCMRSFHFVCVRADARCSRALASERPAIPPPTIRICIDFPLWTHDGHLFRPATGASGLRQYFGKDIRVLYGNRASAGRLH
jgi:hypothetical protein